MTRVIQVLRAIFLIAVVASMIFSCSSSSGDDDTDKTFAVSVFAGDAQEGESVVADVSIAVQGTTITLTASLGAGAV